MTFNVDEFYEKSDVHFAPKQRIWFCALTLFSLYTPLHMVQTIFTGLVPEYECIVNNVTYVNSCGQSKQCDAYHYKPGAADSFVRDWAVSPCNAGELAQVVQSSFTLGVLVGAIALGTFSDYFGRRIALLYCLVGVVVLTVAGSFVPWFWLYVVLRFLQGCVSAGNLEAAYVLFSEIVGPKYRGMCSTFFQSLFGIGIIALAGLSYALRYHWQYLSATIGLLGIALIPLAVFIPESPRWLISQGRVEEGIRTLEYLTGGWVPAVPEVASGSSKAHRSEHLVHVVRKNIVMIMVLLCTWFTNALVYYGLTLFQPTGVGVYSSTAMSGLVELPAYAVCAWMIDSIGRRISTTILMAIAGGSCIAAAFSNIQYLALIGKLSIAASFSAAYIHSAELFPTVVRNRGIGLCSSFARIGGIAASMFLNNSAALFSLSYLGYLCIASGFLHLLLPETLNHVMPQTLEEVEEVSSVKDQHYERLLTDGKDPVDSDDDVEEFSRSSSISLS